MELRLSPWSKKTILLYVQSANHPKNLWTIHQTREIEKTAQVLFQSLGNLLLLFLCFSSERDSNCYFTSVVCSLHWDVWVQRGTRRTGIQIIVILSGFGMQSNILPDGCEIFLNWYNAGVDEGRPAAGSRECCAAAHRLSHLFSQLFSPLQATTLSNSPSWINPRTDLRYNPSSPGLYRLLPSSKAQQYFTPYHLHLLSFTQKYRVSMLCSSNDLNNFQTWLVFFLY